LRLLFAEQSIAAETSVATAAQPERYRWLPKNIFLRKQNRVIDLVIDLTSQTWQEKKKFYKT
jgi:hypothetical protein